MAANSHSLNLESDSSQYVSIANASQTGLDLAGDCSFAFWVKLESAPAADANVGLINKWNASDNHRGYRLMYRDSSGTKRIQLALSDDGTSSNFVEIRWDQTLDTGTWYHIAVTVDISNANATKAVLYVDGVSQGNGTVDSEAGTVDSIFDNDKPFQIGALQASGNASDFLDTLIDEVVVTSDIMSAQEISDLIDGFDAADKIDNKVAYWKFNDSYLDETANNNDLTASGSPVFSTDVPFANYEGTGQGLDLTSKMW